MGSNAKKITVGIVDDHKLLRSAVVHLINSFGNADGDKWNCKVVLEAESGVEIMEKIVTTRTVPDVLLIEIHAQNGYAAVDWVSNRYPGCKVLVLSMYNDETTIVKALKSGAKGYMLKNAEPEELQNALYSMVEKGFYYADAIVQQLVTAVVKMRTEEVVPAVHLTGKETEFLKMVATGLTYREIAARMFLSLRTVDGYREQLFEKLHVNTRTGLVLYAIKNGIVQP